MSTLLTNLNPNARVNLVLAHGAGAGKSSDFLNFFASQLSQHGINIYRFNFEYMDVINETGVRRPPAKMDKLMAEYLSAIDKIDNDLPLIIGGKSMGGRVATQILETCQRAVGAVVLGYPFHANSKPIKNRIEHLLPDVMTKPVLILQGERDLFGNRAEVERFNLSDSVKVQWLGDGDHDFRPRQKSGLTIDENWRFAQSRIVDYMQHLID